MTYSIKVFEGKLGLLLDDLLECSFPLLVQTIPTFGFSRREKRCKGGA